MRLSLALALSTVVCSPSLADSIPLAGEPFRPADIPIEWKATNGQKTLWVYKVVPQTFSSAVISNAMAVGSFKSLDMVKTDDKRLVRFQDHKREERVSRYLEIAPASGWMQYYDSTEAPDVATSVLGVPDPQEAERLGLDMLFKLGVDRTQLAPAPRPTGSMGISKVESSGEEHYIGLQARHIGFIRQIDGISFNGNGLAGGFWVEFGSNKRIKQFELLWRNLVPYEVREVATSAQILETIKTGKAVQPVDVNLRTAKKFTIKSLTPRYQGVPGNELQELVYPVASMNVEAEFSTNKLDFEIACPILAPKAASAK
jgi:hypothetical protein